ncbi:MAG: phosphoglycolate phosphatase [Granulosicoccus sp.]
MQTIDMIAIDLDGTLVDSAGDLHAAVVRMQTLMNHQPATLEDVRHWVGNGIEKLVHRALTGSMNKEASADIFSPAMDAFLSAYDDTNGSASNLYPGVESGLLWLTTLELPMVCVTNKAGRFSRPLLKALGIDRHFSHHIAGDDVRHKKPHPEALLEASRLTNTTPSRCLLIGDSISDILAARAADFSVIAVSYGYNHGLAVTMLTGNERPDAIIDSFEELSDLLPRLRPRKC